MFCLIIIVFFFLIFLQHTLFRVRDIIPYKVATDEHDELHNLQRNPKVFLFVQTMLLVLRLLFLKYLNVHQWCLCSVK